MKITFKYEQLEPECVYHIYNRANGTEKLFRDEGNFRFFLKKYRQYISPVTDTFAYCLMSNHFHFLIRIKSENDVISFYNNNKKTQDISGTDVSRLLGQSFSNFFNSYTKSFNKLFARRGSLFTPVYKRKKVNSSDYLLSTVRYIHLNPVEARLCSHPKLWRFSSYSEITRSDNSFVKAGEVVEWFENLDNFMYMHGAL